jgi:WD40 repeat protein
VASADGSLQFKSHFYWKQDEYFSEDGVLSRTVINVSTGESAFSFQDEPMRILYEERSSPQGCDLNYFSPCGNAVAPLANGPYRAAFSNDNRVLAVLYRPPSLYNSNAFSVLRVYSTREGRMLMQIGDYQQPVEDFALAPNANQIVVGFVDGAVQLWEISNQRLIYSNRHFNAPRPSLDFSSSGSLLLVNRWSEVEARSIQDGSLIARYSGSAFAISPVEDRIAIGDEKGTIRIINIRSGDERVEIAAHKDRIYALQFSDDGRTLVSSGRDCQLQAWDAKTGRLLHKFEETWTDAIGEGWTKSRIFVYSFNFVPGLPQLLGFGSWGRVVSWNLHSGARSFLIEPDKLEYYQGMITLQPHFPESFSVDNQNNLFYIDEYAFDLHTGLEMGEYTRDENIPTGCSAYGPVTKDGRLMFTMGYKERQNQICILDALDKHLIGSFTTKAVGWPYLSPDGTYLIVPSGSGPIYVYAVPQIP